MLGLIGTLGGTLGGIFITNHFARNAEFEKKHIQQAIETYSEVLEEVFGESAFVEISLYAHSNVVVKLADLKEISDKNKGSLENQYAKDAAILLFLTMRKHVIGTDDVSPELIDSIERLHFR